MINMPVRFWSSTQMNKKINKCPHCKGTKGFEARYILGGTHTMHLSFSGKLLWEEREGTDDLDKKVICLDCGKNIDDELVRIK